MNHHIDTLRLDTGVAFTLQDFVLYHQRMGHWMESAGGFPRVGDWIADREGHVRRIGYLWQDRYQLLPATNNQQVSFYWDRTGVMDYSGSLDSPSLTHDDLCPANELIWSEAWFFHGDWPRAHNSVRAMVPCQLYRQTGAARPAKIGVATKGHGFAGDDKSSTNFQR